MIFFLISFLKLWAISGLKKSGGTFLIISDINTGRNKKFNETKILSRDSHRKRDWCHVADYCFYLDLSD